MDTQSIFNAIGTIGFPIVMCLILIYVLYKMNENHKEEMTSLRNSIDTLKEQINTQNVLLSTLLTKLNGDDND